MNFKLMIEGQSEDSEDSSSARSQSSHRSQISVLDKFVRKEGKNEPLRDLTYDPELTKGSSHVFQSSNKKKHRKSILDNFDFKNKENIQNNQPIAEPNPKDHFTFKQEQERPLELQEEESKHHKDHENDQFQDLLNNLKASKEENESFKHKINVILQENHVLAEQLSIENKELDHQKRENETLQIRIALMGMELSRLIRVFREWEESAVQKDNLIHTLQNEKNNLIEQLEIKALPDSLYQSDQTRELQDHIKELERHIDSVLSTNQNLENQVKDLEGQLDSLLQTNQKNLESIRFKKIGSQKMREKIDELMVDNVVCKMQIEKLAARNQESGESDGRLNEALKMNEELKRENFDLRVECKRLFNQNQEQEKFALMLDKRVSSQVEAFVQESKKMENEIQRLSLELEQKNTFLAIPEVMEFIKMAPEERRARLDCVEALPSSDNLSKKLILNPVEINQFNQIKATPMKSLEQEEHGSITMSQEKFKMMKNGVMNPESPIALEADFRSKSESKNTKSNMEEIIRTNKILLTDNNALKTQNIDLEKLLQNLKTNQEKQLLDAVTEIEELKARNSELQEKYVSLQKALDEYKIAEKRLLEEKEQLTAHIRSQESELKSKLQGDNVGIMTQMATLKSKNESLEHQNIELETNLKDVLENKTKLRRQIEELIEKLREKENEMERLQLSQRSASQSSDTLRGSHTLDDLNQGLSEKELENKLGILNEQLESYRAQNEDYRANLTFYKEQHEKYNSEAFAKIQESADEAQEELKDLRAKHERLEVEASRLAEELQKSLEENKCLKTRFEEQAGLEAELVGEHKMLKQEYKKLTEGFEEINQQLENQHEENSRLKEAYQDLEKTFETVKDEAQEKGDEMNKQLESKEIELVDSLVIIQELKAKVDQSEKESQERHFELEEKLKKASEELEEFRTKYKGLEERHQASDKALEVSKLEIKEYQEILEKTNSQRAEEVEELKNKVEVLTEENQELRATIEQAHIDFDQNYQNVKAECQKQQQQILQQSQSQYIEQIEHLKQRLKECKNQLDAADEKVEECENRLKDTQNELEEAREKCKNLQDQLAFINRQKKDEEEASLEISTLQKELEEVKERAHNMEQEVQEGKELVQNLQNELQEASRVKENLRMKLSNSTHEIIKIKLELKEALTKAENEQSKASQLEENLLDLQKELKTREFLKNDLQLKIQNKETQYNLLTERLKILISTKKEEITSLETQIKTLKETLWDTEKAKIEDISELNQSLQMALEDNARLKSEISSFEVQISTVKSDLESLKDQNKSLQNEITDVTQVMTSREEELKNTLEAAEEQLGEVKERNMELLKDNARLKEYLKTKRTRLGELEEGVQLLEKKMSNRMKIDHEDKLTEKMKGKEKEYEEELIKLTEIIQKKNGEILEEGKQRESLERAQEELIGEMVQIKSELKEKGIRLENTSSALNELKGRFNKLRELDSTTQGRLTKLRAILTQKLKTISQALKEVSTGVERVRGDNQTLKAKFTQKILMMGEVFEQDIEIAPKGTMKDLKNFKKKSEVSQAGDSKEKLQVAEDRLHVLEYKNGLLRKAEETLTTKIRSLESEVKERTAEVKECRKKLKESQEESRVLKQQLEGYLAELGDQRRKFFDRDQQNSKKIQDYENQLKGKNAHLEDLEARTNALQSRISRMRARRDSKSPKAAHGRIDIFLGSTEKEQMIDMKAFDQLKKEKEESLQVISELAIRLKDVDEMKEKAVSDFRELKKQMLTERKSMKREVNNYREKLSKMTDMINSLRNSSQAKDRIHKLESGLQEMILRCNDQSDEIRSLKKRLSETKSKLSSERANREILGSERDDGDKINIVREKIQNLLKKMQKFIYDLEYLEVSKLKHPKPTFPLFRKKFLELVEAYRDLRKRFIMECIELSQQGITMFEALEKQVSRRNNQLKNLR